MATEPRSAASGDEWETVQAEDGPVIRKRPDAPAAREPQFVVEIGLSEIPVTHGRHCLCSACAREDWSKIDAPCGMHGSECPGVYAPLRYVNPWRDELLRTLTPNEQATRDIDCCWTRIGESNCVRLPLYRLATPLGHLDYCPEHIGYAIADLGPEWLSSWAYREPVPATGDEDDVPF